jgi:hypothetical protein
MLINLNNANRLDLMRLPHIGVARSYYIIRSRQIDGGFENRECMRRVNGFKGTDRYWNQIDAFVTFGAKSDLPRKETESECYDRLMMERLQREMIASMDTGKGHPWGEEWKK